MINVIGVRFRTAGKIYYFDPVEFEIKKGDHVIVETARGIEFGTVVSGIRQVADDEVILPLKPVLRIASERDVAQEAENKVREKEAYKICLEKIRQHNLDMKLIDAEYTFDNNKVLFYFTSDGRVDFRELVKDLASIFKTRIELRQIGVRDETKMMGGIGMCGRPLCCHTHLSDFIPVSIKMAKEQNLSLNPTKISGVCGRLMCCLNHEEETYEDLNKNLPRIGDQVTNPDGTQGEVVSINVLRQLVKVVVEKGDSKEVCEYKAEDIKFVRRGNRQVKEETSAEELLVLELMEKQDKMDNQDKDEKPAKGQRRERNSEERNNAERNNGERGERFDKKRRFDKNKEFHKNRGDKNEDAEKQSADVVKQPVEAEQPVKPEGKASTEQKEENAHEGSRNRKKPYYRNRKRHNRPEGAKE